MSLNPAHGEVHLVQHYVIKFVSDLRQVSGFLRVLRFPQPQELPLAAIFVGGMGRNEETL